MTVKRPSLNLTKIQAIPNVLTKVNSPVKSSIGLDIKPENVEAKPPKKITIERSMI